MRKVSWIARSRITTRALGPNPNSAEVFNNRGNAYYNKGEVDRAIRDYNKALDLNPNYAEAYYSRSLVPG